MHTKKQLPAYLSIRDACSRFLWNQNIDQYHLHAASQASVFPFKKFCEQNKGKPEPAWAMRGIGFEIWTLKIKTTVAYILYTFKISNFKVVSIYFDIFADIYRRRVY